MNGRMTGIPGAALDSLRPGSVGVLGVPLDVNSSFVRGPAKAPAVIRELIRRKSSNLSAENGLNLATSDAWKDLGDLELTGRWLDEIRAGVEAVLARGGRPLCIGGDHSITYPVMRPVGAAFPGLTILLIDAHSDLYDELDGNRYSHASPFARIMEEGLATRLVQLGIRALTPHQREQAERFDVEIVEMKDWSPEAMPAISDPIYLSIDMDGLDPANAPGVSHPEPGGFTTREVVRIIQSLPARPVGADIVEFNPDRDTGELTAAAAFKLLKEVLGRMLA